MAVFRRKKVEKQAAKAVASESKTAGQKTDNPLEETQKPEKRERRLGSGWIGVDLDGTLAEWHGWHGPEKIGPPIPAMLERVKRWIKMDIEVRIFTARASVEHHIPPVEEWLAQNGLAGLRVTNQKDYKMLQLWDDRSIQVIPNTGEVFKNSNWIKPREKRAARRDDDDTQNPEQK